MSLVMFFVFSQCLAFFLAWLCLNMMFSLMQKNDVVTEAKQLQLSTGAGRC